jgi:hypothetical protein
VIYEGGHVGAAEILRFGLWMTLVAYATISLIALPYWSAVGEPLALTRREPLRFLRTATRAALGPNDPYFRCTGGIDRTFSVYRSGRA